jgi:16S rRNA (cytosine967-C5)-methyltransferase
VHVEMRIRMSERNEQSSVRAAALDALCDIMEEGAFCDQCIHEVLKKHREWDQRDRSFFVRLVEGTVERCLELDYVINRYASLPITKMKPLVREILRMSVYQILYMDRVPDSAACNEGVHLTVMSHLIPLKGFVNGILRNVVRFQEDIAYPSRKKDIVSHLSVWYSMPSWIVKRWLTAYGEKETEQILQTFFDEDKEVSVRCYKTAAIENVIESLNHQGVETKKGHWFDDALRLKKTGNLELLSAFEKGWLQVQDESSMLVGSIAAGLLKMKKKEEPCLVMDACAAPGGKSLHLADLLGENVQILACDISKQKVTKIRENLIRTGMHNVKLKKHDAMEYQEEWENRYDLVIADLPCSGLGVIGKKCDIKYKTKEEDIQNLAQKQKEILQVLSRYVKPGGFLLYSTCTISPEENEKNAAWICSKLPFAAVDISSWLPKVLQENQQEKNKIQILPNMEKTDGFFVSGFQKQR